MKNLVRLSIVGMVVVVSLAGVSCQPTVAPQAPSTNVAPQAAHVDNGRYQIVIGNEGDRGAVLFLLDTRDGGTWIYRPPSPPAFNGFWSDIPRLTYPPETWQKVFQVMVQQAQQAQSAAPGAGSTTAPAPAPAPAH